MLLPFFEWCQNSFVGTWVTQSIWALAVLMAIHLVGLCILGGAILVVDLRMLGVGLSQQRIPELAGYARRWLLVGLAIMLGTGFFLFMGEAIKCYYNPSFWVKIRALPIALLFTFLVRERFAREALDTSAKSRLVGFTSLALWFTVAAAGRWIGFS